ETIDADAWRHDLDSLRKTNEMVNDDCTLVALRVLGSEPEVPALAEPPGEDGSASSGRTPTVREGVELLTAMLQCGPSVDAHPVADAPGSPEPTPDPPRDNAEASGQGANDPTPHGEEAADTAT